MISEAAEFDEFITDHRWAVLTHLRGDGGPVSSVVAYAREADEIVVSTPGKTFKRRALDRDPRVNLCILSNQEPFNFVALEGTATIETTHLEAATTAVFEQIASVGYRLPENLPAWLEQGDRVIIRISPVRVHGVIRPS